MSAVSQRGSEWHKWDLHVHVPSTKLANNYTDANGEVDIDRFCRAIHESGVRAIGLTDYFSLDGFFEVKERYSEMLAEDILTGPAVCLFPNLELRLPDTVNKQGDLVDFHLIFPPELAPSKANEFLANLKTEITDNNSKPLSCGDLDEKQLKTATVTREAIQKAIDATYGINAVRSDYVILIAPINGNGIRPEAGNQRKLQISREIDKFSDGFFGNKKSIKFFLDADRYQNEIPQRSEPKPVFAGSDAHSFEHLDTWLGQEITGTANDKNVTWIKADLSFAGLQQAFIEPSERVRMQENKPDFKEPYTYISRVFFEGTADFPAEISFNQNLNAIIGSRSAGKSALLAHIAHATESDYAKAQQIAAGISEDRLGPAAGFLWTSLGDLRCKVEWADETVNSGKVIYVPQNSLFSISNRPDEITERIRPAVFRHNQSLEPIYDAAISDVDRLNSDLTSHIDAWFDIRSAELNARESLKNLGSKESVENLVQELNSEVEELQRKANLSEEESDQYETVKVQLTSYELQVHEFEKERERLEPYISHDGDKIKCTEAVRVKLDFKPGTVVFASTSQAEYEQLISEISAYAFNRLTAFVEKSWKDNLQSASAAHGEIDTITASNAALILKHDMAKGMKTPLERLDTQKQILAEIIQGEEKVEKLSDEQAEVSQNISDLIAKRRQTIAELIEAFNSRVQELDGIQFELECEIVDGTIERVSRDFNKQSQTKFLNWETRQVDLTAIRNNVHDFLLSVDSGAQKLSKNATPRSVAHIALEATEDFRFVAIMDDDRIGGFTNSSMTPGKQALFSLRLILGESEDRWPLLLDQPEDDLDSRSIFNVIVEELKSRKKERQIIMVTHDANLAVGADSEAVIVANRHGSDQPNVNSQTFDYLTGSLENSHRSKNRQRTLSRAGIREHTCEILDGGEIAFEKRKRKYKI